MANGTHFDVVLDRLLRKIEQDKDFFAYYNVSVTDAQTLVRERAEGYLYDAIDLLTDKCEPDVDFYDYDKNIQQFGFNLTSREIGLLASLMYEVYFTRDEALLKAFKIRMTPSDLNQFSPANERNSFENMLEKIRQKNTNAIAKYVSTDRITGKRKTIDHSQFQY